MNRPQPLQSRFRPQSPSRLHVRTDHRRPAPRRGQRSADRSARGHRRSAAGRRLRTACSPPHCDWTATAMPRWPRSTTPSTWHRRMPTCTWSVPACCCSERQLDEAQAALARATGLDPNQFPAYIIQAQLALGRGDLDEAERLSRTAARIAPEHPHVAARRRHAGAAPRRCRPRAGDPQLRLRARAGRPAAAPCAGFRLPRQGPLRLRRTGLPPPARNRSGLAPAAPAGRRPGAPPGPSGRGGRRAGAAAGRRLRDRRRMQRLVGELELEAGRTTARCRCCARLSPRSRWIAATCCR